MIFEDLKFFSTGRDEELISALRFLERNGGVILTFIGHGVQSKNIHALIVGKIGANATKIACAIEKGIPVICYSWITACAEAETLLDLDNHRYSRRCKTSDSAYEHIARKHEAVGSVAHPELFVSDNWLGLLTGRTNSRENSGTITSSNRRKDSFRKPDTYVDPNWEGSLRKGSISSTKRRDHSFPPSLGNKSLPEAMFRDNRSVKLSTQSSEFSYKTANQSKAATHSQHDQLHFTPIIGRLFQKKHTKPEISSHAMESFPVHDSALPKSSRNDAQPSFHSAQKNNTLPRVEQLSIDTPHYQLSTRSEQSKATDHQCSNKGVSRDHQRLPRSSSSVSRRGKSCGVDRSALLETVKNHPEGKLLDKEMIEQALQQVIINDPKNGRGVSFADISGLRNCKQAILEAIILPFHRPELFTGLRKPSSALLLFGPPGNGKTMLAQAIACECKSTFFSLAASSLISKFVGDSEKAIKTLFTVAHILAPSILFFDEIDALLQSRGGSTEMEGSRRLKTEFLIQVDGVKSNIGGESSMDTRVMVIGATNRPFDLDDAVLRRFPKKIFVPLPAQETRLKILRDLFSVRNDGLYTPRARAGVKIRMSEAEWKSLAEKTEGYSSSDLSSLCKEIALVPIRELNLQEAMEIGEKDLREIVFKDMKKCLHAIKPSTSSALLARLEEWNAQFGSS
ncbi:hypothetical protein XU18_2835 [Perkinsela sp. CCAP 1560/4]|nr:hypothetical protein XU18_2835 [Perkinsela sp. CCAP 1560/4]|eukprot:KNH06330.1 hypothetical protein XU18_2835 [Perkinsela sp. CCAP 1560/4]